MTNAANPYVDPDLIEALYQNPANAVLLAEYAIRTGGVQLGITSSGASAKQDNVIDATLIRGQGGSGGTGGIVLGCPRVDQFITAMGESRFDTVIKPAKNIVPGQFIFDKIGQTWNRVRSVDIIKNQPIWGVAANAPNGKLVCGYSSGSHPIFRNIDDRGIAIERAEAGSTILLNGKDKVKLLACAPIGEIGDVVRIELFTGHRYSYSHLPNGGTIDCHNAKAPAPEP